ncbi:hypothetical protein D8I24_1193 [Cupriavidus necator H850]|nr:hypothetical protein D8I24_1193 [Cupriavidus necator H850]
MTFDLVVYSVGNRNKLDYEQLLLDWKSGISWITVQFGPTLSWDLTVGFLSDA